MPVLYAVLSKPSVSHAHIPPAPKKPNAKKGRLGTIVKAGIIASLLAAAGARQAFGPRSVHLLNVSNMQKLALGHPRQGLRTYFPPVNHGGYPWRYSYANKSRSVGEQLAGYDTPLPSNRTIKSPNAKTHARLEALVKANRLAMRTTTGSSSIAGELASIFNKVALCKSTQVFADDGHVITGQYFYLGRYNFLIDADRVAKSGRLRGTSVGNGASLGSPYLPQCGMKTSSHTWQELANHVRKNGKKYLGTTITEAVMDLNEKDILGLLVDLDRIQLKWPNSTGDAWDDIRMAIGKANRVARKYNKTNPLRNIYIFSPKTNKLTLIRDKAHFTDNLNYYKLHGPLR